MNEVSQNINAILADLAKDSPISYRDFIECALYHPNCGYYRKDEARVGRSPKTDFYTAESLGSVFSELVLGGIQEIIGETFAQHHFVEIAAEPETGLLQRLNPNKFPSLSASTIRCGDPIQINNTAPSIIFANEWLDALPFHRLIFTNGKWQERGVSIAHDTPQEVLLNELSAQVASEAHRLPANAPEGYCLDWPLEAENALKNLFAQFWHGLLIFFDYGKAWTDLIENCPAGTARTYFKHKAGNDLLENIGSADITCDVCWTPLQTICQSHCHTVQLESQEAFFVQRGHRVAESIVTESAGQFSPRRQTLMELIHPAHMGRKFQVLWAQRNP